MNTQKKSIILGAGPIGLVCGWQLLENGWDVEIFEKNEIVGGMCRTWKWDDYLVDTGPHIFHTPDSKLSEFWERNFGDLFIKGDFWCKNVSGSNFENYWDYPLSWESISRFPKDLKTKIMNELENVDSDKKAKSSNYKEYIENQIGPTLTKMFFETYPKKIWGIPTSEMTPDWAPKRIEFRNKVTPFYFRQWNAVGKYGTGCIYDRIKDKIINLGGKINLSANVVALKSENNKINQIEFSDTTKLNIDTDQIIISSLPISLTSKLLGFNCNLEFRGIRSVYLAYNVEHVLPEGIHWLYYGNNNILFNRVTEPKKLSPYVSPKDKTYLTVEITFSKNDSIDLMDENNLIELITNQVEEVGLINKNKFIAGSSDKESLFTYNVYRISGGTV